MEQNFDLNYKRYSNASNSADDVCNYSLNNKNNYKQYECEYYNNFTGDNLQEIEIKRKRSINEHKYKTDSYNDNYNANTNLYDNYYEENENILSYIEYNNKDLFRSRFMTDATNPDIIVDNSYLSNQDNSNKKIKDMSYLNSSSITDKSVYSNSTLKHSYKILRDEQYFLDNDQLLGREAVGYKSNLLNNKTEEEDNKELENLIKIINNCYKKNSSTLKENEDSNIEEYTDILCRYFKANIMLSKDILDYNDSDDSFTLNHPVNNKNNKSNLISKDIINSSILPYRSSFFCFHDLSKMDKFSSIENKTCKMKNKINSKNNMPVILDNNLIYSPVLSNIFTKKNNYKDFKRSLSFNEIREINLKKLLNIIMKNLCKKKSNNNSNNTTKNILNTYYNKKKHKKTKHLDSKTSKIDLLDINKSAQIYNDNIKDIIKQNIEVDDTIKLLLIGNKQVKAEFLRALQHNDNLINKDLIEKENDSIGRYGDYDDIY